MGCVWERPQEITGERSQQAAMKMNGNKIYSQLKQCVIQEVAFFFFFVADETSFVLENYMLECFQNFLKKLIPEVKYSYVCYSHEI